MTAYVGFHTGPGGNASGLSDYFKALDAAGIPAVQKAVDDYGACNELVKLARASGVPHHIIFRLSTAGQNDGRSYDVPNYDIPPDQAARNHWQMTVAKLPPEFDKSRVWLEPINEVDKNRCNWLGAFGVTIAQLAMQQGYKVALFAFSSGEPEPECWRQPGMIDFLRLAAANPDRVAVALHEYTLDKGKTLQQAERWWIGRYSVLYETCDDLGIGRPTILITEFGWTLDWVPSPSTGMPQILWANSKYYGQDRVPTALWYLGGGFGGIANKAQPYIEHVTSWALAEGPPDEPPEPPEPPTPPDEPDYVREAITLVANATVMLKETVGLLDETMERLRAIDTQ